MPLNPLSTQCGTGGWIRAAGLILISGGFGFFIIFSSHLYPFPLQVLLFSTFRNTVPVISGPVCGWLCGQSAASAVKTSRVTFPSAPRPPALETPLQTRYNNDDVVKVVSRDVPCRGLRGRAKSACRAV